MKSSVILALSALAGFATAHPKNEKNHKEGTEIGSNNGASKYLVKSLPQVNFPLPRSWAGNIEIGGKWKNDSLFFWLWESESSRGRDDLILWFNGGPGCSSQIGNMKIHGPIQWPGATTSPKPNPYAWTKAASIVYIDERITTGFSVGSNNKEPTDDPSDIINNPDFTQAPWSPPDTAAAAVQWIKQFFIQFPELKSKRLHFMGESFAGVFMPPVVEALYKESVKLGLNIKSVSVGNAAWGNPLALTSAVTSKYLEAYRTAGPFTRISEELLNLWRLADDKCGFKKIREGLLTYPPSIPPSRFPVDNYFNYKAKRQFDELPVYPIPVGHNGSETGPFIDGYTPFGDKKWGVDQVGWALFMQDDDTGFGKCGLHDAYQVGYILNRDGDYKQSNLYKVDEPNQLRAYFDDNWVAWLNRPDVQTALHVPKIKYLRCRESIQSIAVNREEPPAYRMFPYFLSKGITVNIYGGDLDFVLPNMGALVGIQNMTWNGKQGLQKPPGQVKLLDIDGKTTGTKGKQVGGYNIERGLSFSTFKYAGHRVAQDDPDTSLDWLKKVVLNC